VNNSGKDAWYLEVGDRSPGDAAAYPDDDLAITAAGTYRITKKDGSAY
jgi:uncharacterized cupin superfamily protein